MGFEQDFDKLTFKSVDAFKRKIQPLDDYVLSYCFRIDAMSSKFDSDYKD